jgi:peptidase E
LYDQGNTIVYYTARGAATKVDYVELTKQQLNDWGCKFHELRMNHKPHYDLYICDKSIRIEEL